MRFQTWQKPALRRAFGVGLYGDEGTLLFCGLGSFLSGLLALEAGDEQGAGGVAGDVQRGAAHVEDLVDTSDDLSLIHI